MKLLTKAEIKQVREQTIEREVDYLKETKKAIALYPLKQIGWKLQLTVDSNGNPFVKLLTKDEEFWWIDLYSETIDLIKQDPQFKQMLLERLTNKTQEMIDEQTRTMAD